ncbi:hypothetical protein GEMRC1_010851 [Eukaryota sp. GEM-RC1]
MGFLIYKILSLASSLSNNNYCAFLCRPVYTRDPTYRSVCDKKVLVPARLLADPFLLEALVLCNPECNASDDAFLEHLQSLSAFSSYEEFVAAADKLKLDVRIGNPRERVSAYLRQFLQVRSRASGIGLPDSSLLIRFAKGVYPPGLRSSLISRIKDSLITDLPSLVSTLSNELVDLARVSLWTKRDNRNESLDSDIPSANSDVKRSRTHTRSLRLQEGTCFKCNKTGHFARECPLKVHQVNSISTSSNYANHFLNPLESISSKRERRGSVDE